MLCVLYSCGDVLTVELINEKLICAFRWSVLPSIMKMHGQKNKVKF